MSVLDYAKNYIQNEMAYAINSKGEKNEREEMCKDLYTKWEANNSKEKMKLKNSTNIYIQKEWPLFQKKKSEVNK